MNLYERDKTIYAYEQECIDDTQLKRLRGFRGLVYLALLLSAGCIPIPYVLIPFSILAGLLYVLQIKRRKRRKEIREKYLM